jgi:hypothetical protein
VRCGEVCLTLIPLDSLTSAAVRYLFPACCSCREFTLMTLRLCCSCPVGTDGGLLKKIVKEGSGDTRPVSGQQVAAHYTGTLDDGTKFDSSRDRNKEFKFVIGIGQVIKGWDQGFLSMKKGERAILRCRADYAYGSSGVGPIPPNATLNFDCELIGFGEDNSSGGCCLM